MIFGLLAFFSYLFAVLLCAYILFFFPSAVFCLDPGTIMNGVRTEISLAVGGVAAYQCNAGYRLEGQARLTCLSDATWSHPLPRCICKYSYWLDEGKTD